VTTPDNNLNEWDVAIERPFRLPNKMMIDSELGREGIEHAEEMLGDAHHEAGRALLKLWFNWQREQAQTVQWQQQVSLLKQQMAATEKRLKAGDAPKMEVSQAQTAVAQATVALQLASARTLLAGNELKRQFPAITLPTQHFYQQPQAIDHDLHYWREIIMTHNHELGIAQSQQRIQQKQAERSSADIIPDPTIGLRFSNEMGGNEKVTGVYVTVPLSFGQRSATAEHAKYQAELANQQEAVVKQRLEGDIYAAYTQAVSSYQSWLQAHEAATYIRQNSELVARAYSLGESALSDTLAARRIAMDATLSEQISQLDANEARYRLLLDAHQLWKTTDHDEHH
jgi:outer membrane protein TolC